VRAGEEIVLTRTEFDILAYLARHLDRVVASEMILQEVWGPHHGQYEQTLRVHIGHIRKKIEPDPPNPQYVVTEPGVGYRLTVPAKESSQKLEA
jgi:two-component system KDP operon response regulator KdpE